MTEGLSEGDVDYPGPAPVRSLALGIERASVISYLMLKVHNGRHYDSSSRGLITHRRPVASKSIDNGARTIRGYARQTVCRAYMQSATQCLPGASYYQLCICTNSEKTHLCIYECERLLFYYFLHTDQTLQRHILD